MKATNLTRVGVVLVLVAVACSPSQVQTTVAVPPTSTTLPPTSTTLPGEAGGVHLEAVPPTIVCTISYADADRREVGTSTVLLVPTQPIDTQPIDHRWYGTRELEEDLEFGVSLLLVLSLPFLATGDSDIGIAVTSVKRNELGDVVTYVPMGAASASTRGFFTVGDEVLSATLRYNFVEGARDSWPTVSFVCLAVERSQRHGDDRHS